ncbi:13353_t:CDS:2, partial [Funneliformis geosporum]
LTQINFIENTRSSPNKTLSYAWEKREEKESTMQSIPSTTEIAKSLSAKFNKRKDPQEKPSSPTSNLNINYNSQDDTQLDISDDRNEILTQLRKTRGRKKK